MAASSAPGPAGIFVLAPAQPPPPRHGFPPGPTRKVKPLVAGLSRRRDCLPGTQVTLSDGTVGHSGFLSHAELFGLVEAKTDVTALRSIDREEKIHQVALSFQARTVGEANWLQFLGPSVVGVFSRGSERLVGELAFNERRVKVKTSLSPGDTPYFLDSEGNPFANRPKTTLCEELASGQEKIPFSINRSPTMP